MSALCDIALTVGLTLFGVCVSEERPQIAMPENDRAAWAVPRKPPEPEPPAEAEVQFPPIVLWEGVPEQATPSPVTRTVPVSLPRDTHQSGAELVYAARLRAAERWEDIEPIRGELRIDTPEPLGVDTSTEVVLPPLSELDLPEEVRAAALGSYEYPGVSSTPPVDNRRILTTDRYIVGILETGINSQLDTVVGGSVVIQVARDVFGYHGRLILVPKGSRLTCDYKTLEEGSTRLGLECKRVLLAGTRAEIYQVKALVGDQQGRSGITGEVDNRFLEKYGTAFLLSGISAAIRGGAASVGKEGSPEQIAAEELTQNLGNITTQVIESTLSLRPTITIPQGTRVQIRPSNDWYISAVGEANTSIAGGDDDAASQ